MAHHSNMIVSSTLGIQSREARWLPECILRWGKRKLRGRQWEWKKWQRVVFFFNVLFKQNSLSQRHNLQTAAFVVLTMYSFPDVWSFTVLLSGKRCLDWWQQNSWQCNSGQRLDVKQTSKETVWEQLCWQVRVSALLALGVTQLVGGNCNITIYSAGVEMQQTQAPTWSPSASYCRSAAIQPESLVSDPGPNDWLGKRK